MSGKPICSRRMSRSSVQRPQVLLGGVHGLEAEFFRDFRPGWRHAGFHDRALDQPQNLGLSRRQIGHDGSCIYKQ
jgi:hypothetical protein